MSTLAACDAYHHWREKIIATAANTTILTKWSSEQTEQFMTDKETYICSTFCKQYYFSTYDLIGVQE